MAAAAALLCAALVAVGLLATAERAGAAGPVTANGQIRGCYKAKGKGKGALRVSTKKKCKKGEKPLVWSVQGPAGPQGATGPGGDAGLISRVTELESILNSVTNTDLLNAIAGATKLTGISATDLQNALANAAKLDGITALQLADTITEAAKLNGISATELADAVGAVADVQALCTQVASVTSTLNALNTAVGGLDLGGVIPLGLLLDIPALPAQLGAFSCS